MKIHGGLAWPDVDDFMWREVRVDGSYQRAHLVTAMQFVTDRRCAIDGGAHVGQFSIPMSALFRKVIAFEPAPDTFDCLVENLSRCRNVEARNSALNWMPGTVSLRLDEKQQQRGNTGGRYMVENLEGDEIPCEAIDEFDLPALGLLKLDIEGAEPRALNGAEDTIKRCRPVVLFEDKGFCMRLGYPKDASQTFLAGLGYEHKARCGYDEIWVAA